MRISVHAAMRIEEMAVTQGELDSVIAYPMKTWQNLGEFGPRTTYQGRRIAVVTGFDQGGELVVITVVWTDPDVADILQPGRRKV